MNTDLRTDRLGDELCFTVMDDERPLIAEGIYEVVYVKHEKGKFFSSIKLFITFEIVTPGEHLGVRLFKVFNLYEPLRRSSDLFKALVLIHGRRVGKKTKLPISLFKARVLKVYVRTVKHDRKQDLLAPHLTYSVIDRILSVTAGGET